MRTPLAMVLTFSKPGRILLHLACIVACPQTWRWQWQGIKRELALSLHLGLTFLWETVE